MSAKQEQSLPMMLTEVCELPGKYQVSVMPSGTYRGLLFLTHRVDMDLCIPLNGHSAKDVAAAITEAMRRYPNKRMG